MKITHPAALLLLLATPLDAWADERVPVRPEEVGLSSSRLKAIDTYFREEVERKRIAGAVVLIARHGKTAYVSAIGQSDVAAGRPMAPDTIFRIASMTKAVTSVAAMMLVEEGRLRLADPVSRYLPEFTKPVVLSKTEGGASSGENYARVPAHREITIHDLLSHTAGLTYGRSGPPGLDELYGKAAVADVFMPTAETMADRVKRLAALPLKFNPGVAWDYGMSTDVLGRVVEAISGRSLDEFCGERIFRPLGMKDTHFVLPAAKRDRLAALFTSGADGSLQPVPEAGLTAAKMTFSPAFPYAGGGKFFSGGSGLVSTAPDYARFLQLLLSGGERDGIRLVRKDSVRRMTENQIGDLRIPFGGHGDGFGYGLGVLTERGKSEDLASVGTFSWGGSFNTYFWVDPKNELIGILMTQIAPFNHLTERADFKRLAYAALLEASVSEGR
ncbi:MAG: serine hydrolase domain-containing protein [Opitutaceae bacterium]|nr:serine hydrolase domain-containing protein [Opitutaceae bacterium]